MISFLHTADWQIGRVFSQFEPDDAAALFEARFKAVERLAALATERNVDAVLVAGDVFDAQTIADKTVRRLFNALQGFAGPWLLLPGNHDAALSESVWTRAHRLGAVPANVVCCLAPRPHSVAGKFTVLPAPLTQRHTYEDLTAWFDTAPSPEGQPRIGLAHGCVQGILADGIDSANPIAPQRAQQARLDYLALGDWHGTRRIDGATWYAGTPETDRFKANDSGQALHVTLAGAGAQPGVQLLHTGQFRWQQCTPSTPKFLNWPWPGARHAPRWHWRRTSAPRRTCCCRRCAPARRCCRAAPPSLWWWSSAAEAALPWRCGAALHGRCMGAARWCAGPPVCNWPGRVWQGLAVILQAKTGASACAACAGSYGF